jgi:hypothetical protein
MTLNQKKFDKVTEYLGTGQTVLLYLDPRLDNVLVPEAFSKQSLLVLQIGYNMAIPIPDLELQEKGVLATLTFNRRPFQCFVPWEALQAAKITDENTYTNWSYVPKGPAQSSMVNAKVGESVQDSRSPSVAKECESPVTKKRPNHLRLVVDNT